MRDRIQDVLTVSMLNDYIKSMMERDDLLAGIAVRGEISGFKNHYATGHYYFSLKDTGALVRCVMFSSYASKLKFIPENGMQAIVWGHVSLYPRDGAYQIYVSAMTPDGLGEQYAAFEQLKTKLGEEGLFDPGRKKAIPRFPDAIGIVTSATGAAVRDLINILGRRYPPASILLYPATVQGAGTPAEVTAGIQYFNNKANVDTIIIGRGGGSPEDLAGFNDEGLARAIAASRIPIISAVGHETDFTISDFVADLRASTPSAAAELAVPDTEVLKRQLDNAAKRCGSIMDGKLTTAYENLRILSESSVLSRPARLVDIRRDELSRLSDDLVTSYMAATDKRTAVLSHYCTKLESLSPLAVLGRGYTTVRSGEKTVCHVSDLQEGQKIRLVFGDGTADATVDSISPEGTVSGE